jgi:low temperature requirement protein LtrA
MTGRDEPRVSTLELFFDLVFVFTLTQLTALLAADPSVEGVAHVMLIFIVLFWMYGGYVWLTNQIPPDRSTRRLLVMVGMAAFLVCALAIPRAFDGGGVAFGLGYLLVVLVHAGLYAVVAGIAVVARFAPLNLVSAICVTIAGLLDGPAVYGLWVAAVLSQFLTPFVAARVAPRIEIRTAHFVERHGLLLIVAFGESVVAIGIGTLDVTLGPSLFGAAVLGLALAAGLWWAYFVGDEEGAERAMGSASADERFRLAINGYFFSYIPMLLGVIAIAAGVKLSIGDVADRLDVGPALTLGGGVALFLAGEVSFRRVMGIRPVGYRTGAALVALGTVFLGIHVAAVVQLIALVATLAATFALEAGWPRAELAVPSPRTGPPQG